MKEGLCTRCTLSGRTRVEASHCTEGYFSSPQQFYRLSCLCLTLIFALLYYYSLFLALAVAANTENAAPSIALNA